MKRFEFRLEGVRRYRHSMEKEKIREFSEASRIYQQEAARLWTLLKEEQTERGSLRRELKGRCDPGRVRALEIYLERLYRRIEEQKERTEQAAALMEAKRRELVEASKERKVMDKLYARSRERYLYQWEKEEREFLDEVAGARFIARNLGAGERQGEEGYR